MLKHKRILREFFIIALKDQTGIVMRSKCNYISLLKEAHQDWNVIRAR